MRADLVHPTHGKYVQTRTFAKKNPWPYAQGFDHVGIGKINTNWPPGLSP